jgi:ferredoxin
VIEIKLDRRTCQGYGNCVLVAPGLFELDEDGLAVVRQTHVGDDQLDAVQKAAYDCPTSSIAFAEGARPPD